MNDFPEIASAWLVFAPIAFSPGFLLAYLCNLWQFRNRTFAFQLAASVPLSLSVGPIITFVAWKFAWVVYVGAALGCLLILVRQKIAPDRTAWKALAIGLGWSLFAAVWLMDWRVGRRVYFPIYALDYATRAAMVHSLAAFGLPAQTPFFTPGHPVVLHYHYLWLLQCAFVHSLAPGFITARLAFIAGAIWCGLGLMCVAALGMRILMQRRSWIVVGLLAVTGLDLIPALVLLFANRLHLLSTLPPSAEWWNEQVDGWVYTVLWEPHYICSLIACITGLLVIWESRRVACMVVAALCFATAVGSGSFVALVFAAFLALWVVFHFRESVPLLIAGLLTILFSLPYLATLRGPAENVGSSSLLTFAVRHFSPFPLPLIGNLLTLPLNYFLELGFFAACVFVGYRRKLVRNEWMLMLMAFTSILICTFVKSGATPNNDLGWRGFLVAQFALLILSAGYLEKVRPTGFLKTLLVIGLLGTGYDLLLTRLFPMLSDAGEVPKLKWLALDQKLGERTAANREAYEWLHKNSSQTALLGQNPDVHAVDVFYGLYADRKTVAGDRNCTIGFGGTVAECARITPLLASPVGACRQLPIDFYILRDTDPAWKTEVKGMVFENQFVRIISCERSNGK